MSIQIGGRALLPGRLRLLLRNADRDRGEQLGENLVERDAVVRGFGKDVDVGDDRLQHRGDQRIAALLRSGNGTGEPAQKRQMRSDGCGQAHKGRLPRRRHGSEYDASPLRGRNARNSLTTRLRRKSSRPSRNELPTGTLRARIGPQTEAGASVCTRREQSPHPGYVFTVAIAGALSPEIVRANVQDDQGSAAAPQAPSPNAADCPIRWAPTAKSAANSSNIMTNWSPTMCRSASRSC